MSLWNCCSPPPLALSLYGYLLPISSLSTRPNGELLFVAVSCRSFIQEASSRRTRRNWTPAEAVGETIWTGRVNMININQNRRNQINCEYIVSYQMECICFQSPLCSFSPLFSLSPLILFVNHFPLHG